MGYPAGIKPKTSKANTQHSHNIHLWLNKGALLWLKFKKQNEMSINGITSYPHKQVQCCWRQRRRRKWTLWLHQPAEVGAEGNQGHKNLKLWAEKDWNSSSFNSSLRVYLKRWNMTHCMTFFFLFQPLFLPWNKIVLLLMSALFWILLRSGFQSYCMARSFTGWFCIVFSVPITLILKKV